MLAKWLTEVQVSALYRYGDWVLIAAVVACCLGGAVLLAGKSDVAFHLQEYGVNTKIYLGRLSEPRFFAGVFAVLNGLTLLVARSVFFAGKKTLVAIFAVSVILLVTGSYNSLDNYLHNDRYIDDGGLQEYRFIAHWSFYDLDSGKLRADFSLDDWTKNFHNTLGSDGVHRIRWVGMVLNSMTAKFNTWFYHKWGRASFNVFCFIGGLLLCGTIAFFIWRVTADLLLAFATAALYFSSYDFMFSTLNYFRANKPLLSVPFLLLILALAMRDSTSEKKPLGRAMVIGLGLLFILLLGLDEFGWCMAFSLFAALVVSEWMNSDKVEWDSLKKPMAACAVTVAFTLLVYVSTIPSFVRDTAQLTGHAIWRHVEMVFDIPYVLTHFLKFFSDTFFFNNGFYKWQDFFAKPTLSFVYLTLVYLVWYCCRRSPDNRQLKQYACVLGITTAVITLFTQVASPGAYPKHTWYGYYSSYLTVGYVVLWGLVGHTLRINGRHQLYAATVFAMALVVLVNSFGFNKVDELAPEASLKKAPWIAGLTAIESEMAKGKTPVLDDDLSAVSQKPWVKHAHVRQFYGDEFKTLPLLYYYILPYIGQGRVQVRQEYIDLIE